MWIRAQWRANRDLTQAECSPTKQIGKPKAASKPAGAKKKQNNHRHDQRGPDVCMEGCVNGVMLVNQVVQRLKVNEDIGCAEGQEAPMPGCGGMKQRTRTEMKRSYGHESDARQRWS
jgi:hypothetical protein